MPVPSGRGGITAFTAQTTNDAPWKLHVACVPGRPPTLAGKLVFVMFVARSAPHSRHRWKHTIDWFGVRFVMAMLCPARFIICVRCLLLCTAAKPCLSICPLHCDSGGGLQCALDLDLTVTMIFCTIAIKMQYASCLFSHQAARLTSPGLCPSTP